MLLFFAVPTVPIQHHPRSQQRARESQSDAKYTDSPPAAITNNQATSYYQQQAPDKPHGWHKFFTWPEGITTLAIVLTLGAIVWQAFETRRSVGIAKESILLQETAYKQWVEVVNWKSTITPHILMPQIDISAEITNLTNFPLTLKSASVTFGNEPSTTTFLVGEGRFLPPKSPVKIEVTLPITPAKRTSFEQNSLGIPITGCFQFIGILKKVATQDLGGILICGAKETRFESTVPMQPKENN